MNTGPRGGCTFLFGSLSVSALALLLWLAALTGVFAQAPVTTLPFQGANAIINSSGTIAVTNTFQPIWPQTGKLDTPSTNRARVACTVQNTGTNPMYVFFGPIASATIAASVKIVAGQAAFCNIEGTTLQDAVSITGTSTETYYAAQQ